MADQLLSLVFDDRDLSERIYFALDMKAAMVANGLGKPRSKITSADVRAANDAKTVAEQRICTCEATIRRLQVALGISPSEMKWTEAREKRERRA